MQTLKGGIGVLALMLAASFPLLLSGCQNQEDRTGTVSLTIGQLNMSRAIQPDIPIPRWRCGGHVLLTGAVAERQVGG